MTSLLKQLELPLLSRELRELARRRRTYVLRVVYAALLFWFAIIALGTQLSMATTLADRGC